MGHGVKKKGSGGGWGRRVGVGGGKDAKADER